MRRTHTTTKNPITYVRIVLIAVISALFVVLAPYADEKFVNFYATHALNLSLLFAIIIGFLMSISIQRHQQLEEHISIELNKVRRIYHLAYYISKRDKKQEAWFKRVNKAITDYLTYFKTHSFREYEGSNALFREVTYRIYDVPNLNNAYDEALYASLLDASAEVTVAREQILAKKDYRIGRYQWVVLLSVSIAFCSTMAVFTPPDLGPRFTTGVVIFCFFLSLDLLFEYDFSNPIKYHQLARQYFENLERITMKGAKKKAG